MTTTYTLPFGRGRETISLPDTYHIDCIDPAAGVDCELDPAHVIAEALDHPLDKPVLLTAATARSAAVIINDKTRPVPHHLMLPPLLQRLEQAGLPPEAIRIIIATGTHTPMPAYEFGRLLPDDILARYPVISHDCDDRDNLVYLGQTSRQSPVWINRIYYESDIRIATGNIEPHHFAGFSGGAKSVAIGVGGRETITHNHAMLLDPNSRIAEVEKNLIRQDIEEIGAMVGDQYALNVVMNASRQVVAAFFGDPRAVVAAGIPVSRSLSQVSVDQAYDVVIASAGGHPKDINFYQAQKAMTYAAEITRPGGTIILVTACPEGVGSQSYVEFMNGIDSYEGIFARFKERGFQVGPHKALQVARIAGEKRVILVSQMAPEDVYQLLITPAPDVQSGFELIRGSLPAAARIAVLPHATNMIPVVKQS